MNIYSRWVLNFVVLLLTGMAAFGQAGPPFRTDDPDTPGNRQWEINFGLVGDRNLVQGSYSLPNVDVNYGLGDRIQLKYELPFSVAEQRGDPTHLAGGIGNSLIGVKWRFYEQNRDRENGHGFRASVYPQLVLTNSDRSVGRALVDRGPRLLLPLEASVGFGPVRVVAETGYWLAGKDVADSWIQGAMIGHEFASHSELYLEFYDQRDVGGPARETTLGIGGRQPITRCGDILFIGMAGRSILTRTDINKQPEWIAYLGVQVRLGPKQKREALARSDNP